MLSHSLITRLITAAAVVVACHDVQAGQRAFVSSTGNDANTANNCAPATPCRSFTAAHSVVDPGGEIIALDAAGYGAITVTKSVSIIGNPGSYAGIAATSGDAVTIATASINVILRNLNINGNGTGNIGVNMTNGSTLMVDGCLIYGFGWGAVDVTTAANVRVVNSTFRNNGNYGLRVDSGATVDVSRTIALGNGIAGFYVRGGGAPSVTTTGTFTDTVATQNAFGFASQSTDATATTRSTIIRSSATENSSYGFFNANANGPAIVTVSYSMASFNGTGFFNSATFYTQGNNTVNQNGTNVNGALTPLGGT